MNETHRGPRSPISMRSLTSDYMLAVMESGAFPAVRQYKPFVLVIKKAADEAVARGAPEVADLILDHLVMGILDGFVSPAIVSGITPEQVKFLCKLIETAWAESMPGEISRVDAGGEG